MTADVAPFPQVGIMPKQEVGALRFLEKHPEFDGRGVVIAIFDTGVDPGAAGLQTTSDGKPKIIDVIDGTGSGDVKTSTVREATNHQLQGLTGRTLKLSPAWANPDGQFHLGLKSAYSLFPAPLVSRMKRERRKRWGEAHRKTEEALRSQLVDWGSKHPKPTVEDKKSRADLETRVKQLKVVAQQYDDPGPIYDCLVFYDGSAWRAVVDTDEDGDLAEEKLLTNFRAERQFATFDSESLLNFAVNIFDEGKRLSIICESGAHGTHVAGITAGHFPDHPEQNGIAPGAQIVSVKIGDSRLGGMETGAGLVRGLRAVIENHCDLINMSYGEPTTTPNRGRLVELFSELVDKHGVIFVASAGNAGPALSTVGAPGGTTSAIIGVGAFVSPEMMAAEYTLRKQLPGMPYTWTSRGPTFDGDLGVDIFAPGGAIAPVPGWTLQGSMRMNGTSMASPNACGSVALLLSGMKANSTPYSPYSVRRALKNTARRIDAADVFAQGPGLVQIDRAFDHLTAHAAAVGEQLPIEARLANRSGARGVYLREPHEVDRPTETSLRVRPVFPKGADNKNKVGFQLRLAIQSTAEWVTTGQFLLLTQGGGTFSAHVDPSDLSPGAHFAEVCGYDSDAPDRGPLFRFPITVTIPDESESDDGSRFSGQTTFQPGQVERHFVAVPADATWATLKLRSRTDAGEQRTYVVHTVQIVSGRSYRATENRRYVSLKGGEDNVHVLPVLAGRTLEVCMAQYWSSLGTSELEYELTFHGILPDDNSLTLSAAEPTVSVNVAAPLYRQRIAPTAKLTTHRTTLSPTSADIKPLAPSRDVLPNGRHLYVLELTYNFSQAKSGTVTPSFPLNDDLLYDSSFGTQLWSIFDAGKHRITTDDIFPGSVKLRQGKHVLKLQLRHDNVAKLETMKKALLTLDRPLSSPVSLGVYGSRAAAVSRGGRFPSSLLERGERVSLWVGVPASVSLPAGAAGGDILLGTVTYGTARDGRRQSGQRPGGFPVQYVIPNREGTKPRGAESPKLPADETAFRIAKLKSLITAADDSQFNRLAEQILKEHSEHLPTLVAQLHRLDQIKNRKQHLPKVVTAADAVIARLHPKELAAHFGTNVNPGDTKAVQLRKTMNDHKAILIDTLYRKGRALGYMELPDVVARHPVEDQQAHDKAFAENFAELARWVDTTAREYVLLHIRRERRQARYGNALQLLNKYIPSSEPNYWYIKKRRDVFEKLGWTHCWEQEKRRLMIQFPKEYEPF
ncbi:MAG: S8 family serine peptidase [Planctomycetaceae bacterium]|nr:S8 family serine peptidase [Planctomycetaceae bacterium]MBT6485909.1 S8 family serine peptidase [Planctomycetaceae bacterium]